MYNVYCIVCTVYTYSVHHCTVYHHLIVFVIKYIQGPVSVLIIITLHYIKVQNILRLLADLYALCCNNYILRQQFRLGYRLVLGARVEIWLSVWVRACHNIELLQYSARTFANSSYDMHHFLHYHKRSKVTVEYFQWR